MLEDSAPGGSSRNLWPGAMSSNAGSGGDGGHNGGGGGGDGVESL